MAPKFVSLGMVVLDELRFPHAATMHDVPGGSGAFSTLGARLVAGKDRSYEVGCLIMAGDDFPETTLAQFESWGVDLVVSRKPGRQSTRGLLVYEDREFGHVPIHNRAASTSGERFGFIISAGFFGFPPPRES
ncbi:hypothetical protein SLS64_005080 [Diaporthe eres]|uniref:Carbohydrate kinase PfkB domain-containing protein n=1 Tax=Diaporthe eres TaxID=83184 RepID=A0ABR1P5M7_DIAER